MTAPASMARSDSSVRFSDRWPRPLSVLSSGGGIVLNQRRATIFTGIRRRVAWSGDHKPPLFRGKPSTSTGRRGRYVPVSGMGHLLLPSGAISSSIRPGMWSGELGRENDGESTRADATMSAAGTVLVTGATGFVGSAVARALLDAGRSVRVLVRPGSRCDNLAGLDLEIAEGDMRDAAGVRRAMAGIRHLFHAAADYRLWAPQPIEILTNNLIGTRN